MITKCFSSSYQKNTRIVAFKSISQWGGWENKTTKIGKNRWVNVLFRSNVGHCRVTRSVRFITRRVMESRGWWGPPKRRLVPCLLSSRHAVRCFLGLTDKPFHFAFSGQTLSALCHLGKKKKQEERKVPNVFANPLRVSPTGSAPFQCYILRGYSAKISYWKEVPSIANFK